MDTFNDNPKNGLDLASNEALHIANPTPRQVADWKEQFGKIKVVQVDGKDIYFKQPTRALVAAANTLLVKKGVSAYADSILKNCQLNFIQETKEDDEIYFALTAKVDEIITTKTAALKNE